MTQIDLHGVKHANVREKLEEFFKKEIQKKNSQIKVITGQSDMMKEIVSQTAKDFGLTAEQNPINPGCLLIWKD
jgi:DNA-nicking Smr family endonuclease